MNLLDMLEPRISKDQLLWIEDQICFYEIPFRGRIKKMLCSAYYVDELEFLQEKNYENILKNIAQIGDQLERLEAAGKLHSSFGCTYGQPDGPDDFVTECECPE